MISKYIKQWVLDISSIESYRKEIKEVEKMLFVIVYLMGCEKCYKCIYDQCQLHLKAKWKKWYNIDTVYCYVHIYMNPSNIGLKGNKTVRQNFVSIPIGKYSLRYSDNILCISVCTQLFVGQY